MTVTNLNSGDVASALRLRYARADAAVKRTQDAAYSPASHSYREHHEAIGMRSAVRDLVFQIADTMPAAQRELFIDSCALNPPGH